MHVPGVRWLALRTTKPCRSKMARYHGRRPAERSRSRPPSFRALFKVRICSAASDPCGSNQSIESMMTAMVSVPGLIRVTTSLMSSVWMRRPSNAPGRESLAWAFAET